MHYHPPGPVSAAFLSSTSPIRFIEGPIESGKSSTCAMAIYSAMCEMPLDRSGKRRSRWLITRNTYPDLRGSTVETWLDWFKPELYGKFRDTEPYLYQMRFRDVEADVVFESYADDKDDTIRALRSKEYTGAWVNEMQFMPRRLVFEIATRTGRFPRLIDMPPGYRKREFLIGDNNAPFTNDHWILRMRGDTPLPLDMPPEERMQYAKPVGVEFFRQPAALKEIVAPDGETLRGYQVNPLAENLANMSDGVRSSVEVETLARDAAEKGAEPPIPHRYIALTGGKTKDEIDRDLMGRVARVKGGAAATPQFRAERHVCRPDAKPIDGAVIVMGADHGLTPVCLFGQQINGGWVVFSELCGENMDTDEFAPLVKAHLQTHYPWVTHAGYAAWGDPQGDWRGSNSTNIPHKQYAAHGVVMRAPALKDRPQLRLSAIRRTLGMEFGGKPKLMVHPNCVRLIAALDGGAQVRRVKTTDGLQIVDEIVKNAWSHPFDALGYLLWGGGEVKELLAPAGPQRPRIQNAIPKKRRLITVGRRRA